MILLPFTGKWELLPGVQYLLLIGQPSAVGTKKMSPILFPDSYVDLTLLCSVEKEEGVGIYSHAETISFQQIRQVPSSSRSIVVLSFD